MRPSGPLRARRGSEASASRHAGVIGTMTIHADGTPSDRTGRLQEIK